MTLKSGELQILFKKGLVVTLFINLILLCVFIV